MPPRYVGFLVLAALLVLGGVGALFAARDRPEQVVAPAMTAQDPSGAVPAAPGVAAPAAAPTDDPGKGTAHPHASTAPEEAGSVERLRALAVADPGQALHLAADLDRRFPKGALVEERASLVIDALVKLGDIGQARTNAEDFFARFPRGRFGVHVETLTGVHPRPTEGETP